MAYKLEELIDLQSFQTLQEKLNDIYSFPSAIIDSEGKILIAVAWQDICTKFHRINSKSELECIKSDKYISEHLSEANPAVSYKCPHGMIDNAIPIIIDGVHYANFFTGQLFLEKPDMEFFKKQAKKFDFDEKTYLEAVEKVPVWTKEKLDKYLVFIKEFVEILGQVGLKHKKEIETRKIIEQNEKDLIAKNYLIEESEKTFKDLFDKAADAIFIVDLDTGLILDANLAASQLMQTSHEKLLGLHHSRLHLSFNKESYEQNIQVIIRQESKIPIESKVVRPDGSVVPVEVMFSSLVFKGKQSVMGTFRDITERKKSDELLKESNQFSQQVINSANEGIIVYDTQMRYTVWNPFMEKLSGVAAADVLGKHPLEVFPFLKDAGVIDIIDRAIKGETQNAVKFPYEITGTGKKGWTSDTTAPLYNIQGEIIGAISTVRDITDEKKTKEDLHEAKEKAEESEEKFRIIYQSSSDAIMLLNREGFLDCNQQALKIFGITNQEELINTHPSDLSPSLQPDGKSSFEASRNHIETAFANGSDNFKWVHKRKNGELFSAEVSLTHFDFNHQKIIQATVRDITERELAEKNFRHQHDLMSYIIEHNRSAIAVHDRDLNYVYVSKSYLKDYKIKDENIIGKHHYEVFPDLPQKWRIVHQKALLGEVLSAEDDSYEKDDGTVEWTRWECRPWYEASGSIGGIIIYTEVITGRKRVEQELVKAKEKAEESDRLKTTFLQNMSHEVRTPLNSIVGFSQLMAETNPSPDKLSVFSKNITRSSQKLLNIMSDVLEISQIQANQIQANLVDTDILLVLNTIVNRYSEKAKNKGLGIIFNQNIPFNEFVIKTDNEKLTKIFTHLISNAFKFTHTGSVSITCEIIQDSLHFAVTDTGIGISDEAKGFILEPFRQVEVGATRNYGGNGLGLSIAKAYTELLKGKLTLQSEVNKGTTVSVSIPVKKSNEDLIRKVNPEPKYSISTILIAEDEYYNFMYLSELLENFGLKILHATNGQQAIDFCRNNSVVDLVLMDIKMPIMDGHTATKLIKEFRPSLPVIAQSAYTSEHDKSEFMDVFDDYISKPIDMNEFKQKLKKYIKM